MDIDVININEVNDQNGNITPQKSNKDNNQDFNEQYNILFDDDNEDIKHKNNQNLLKSSDLNLDKELSQSKRNININEEKDFLSCRKWDYLDESKRGFINNKIEEIYKEMNKNQLKSLNKSIENCNLDAFYKNFNPNENCHKIGGISSLEFLIETTYCSISSYIKLMTSDKAKLEQYIYKYRQILGDGNCFYRGLIFSFLENIIVTQNIMLLKELIILFDEKINVNNPLINQKEYLIRIKNMNISIITQILYILLKKLENNVEDAYRILLKVFIYAKDFDYGIIYFTRYLLFEYILLNNNKIFSRENQIEIGCLLPEDYVVDKGNENEYLFENYYNLQLMKPASFAEKIVIYISPFVFNCDINILIYDYGTNSFIEEKKFISDKKSIYQINLLFRKSHYDIYYKKKFYDKYSNYLDILNNNIYENIQFLNSKNPEDILGRSNINLNNSNINNLNPDYEKMFAEQDNNNDNTPKCLECKKPYNHKENAFGLCENCLLSILKTQIMSNYLVYLQTNEKNPISYFNKLNCTISVHSNIPLMTAIFNSGYKFEELFLEIRKTMCLFCGFNIDINNYYIELPCKCRICKKDCFEDYCNRIGKTIEITQNDLLSIGFKSLNCPCGYKYKLESFLYMINEMKKRKLEDCMEKYQKFIKMYWKWKCMMCESNFSQYNGKYYRLLFSDDEIKKLTKKKFDLKHLICQQCAIENHIDKAKTINCQFCNSTHNIKEFLEVDKENNDIDSSCVII